jgi:hypothetical protein
MPVINPRVSKPDDIYIVVTLNPVGGSTINQKFSFFTGTRIQLEQLHIPKSQIVATRLSPLFLRPELKLFCAKEAKKIGSIRYFIHSSKSGLIAESRSYFPKEDVDPEFAIVLNTKPKNPAFELKGISGYLEAICVNYLHLKYRVQKVMTPRDSSDSREKQLSKGELRIGVDYDIPIWQKGMGRIIRRRINLPKHPL